MRNAMTLVTMSGVLMGLTGCLALPNEPGDGDVLMTTESAVAQGRGAQKTHSAGPLSSSLQSATQCWDLSQGPKNNDYGDVCIANDGDTIYVTYTADISCPLREVHVCASTTDYPWTPPGQCSYNVEFHDDHQTSYTVAIPLSDFPDAVCGETVFYIQAHAALACGQSAYGNTFKGNIGYTLQCTDDSGGCTRTQGYWKNHASDWSSVDLTLGGVTYSHAQAMAILQTPSNGDASLIMSHQLIAAKLNLLVNSASGSAVSSAVSDADAWLAANADADGSLPFGVSPSSAAGAEAVALSSTLDQFNNGLIGPGHCEK